MILILQELVLNSKAPNSIIYSSILIFFFLSKKRKRKKTFFIPISSKDAAKEVCPEISSITTARDIYQFVILSAEKKKKKRIVIN